MLQDIRYAYRNLRRSPLFTSIALVSLALGIGANSAIFTLTDQVLLRSLPVRHAGELLYFRSPGPQSGMVWGPDRFSYPMFQDLRDHNLVFAQVAARFDTPLNLSYRNRSEHVTAEIVSGNYFETLGLQTAIGRGLTADDNRVPGGHSVAVLTYDYWQTHMGGDRGILNQVLLLNGHPMTVIGVAAPGYRGFDVGQRVDVLVPAMMNAQMTPTWNGLENRRIPLRLGREFQAGDRLGAPQVAIVNEAFAKYFFKGENPLGRHVGFGRDKGFPIEIVGVVANAKYSNVNEQTARMMYTPFAQQDRPGSLVVYARAAGEPEALFPSIRRAVRQIDPALPVNLLRTMEEQVDVNLSAPRLIAMLSSLFAALATILAAIGLYGVMAYTVTRRTREIGIRLALGAGRGNVLRLVMREVAILTAAGVAVALPCAVALTRLLRSELYGVGPNDPLSMAAALVAMVAVALLAGYVPAERATRVNPNVALRYE